MPAGIADVRCIYTTRQVRLDAVPVRDMRMRVLVLLRLRMRILRGDSGIRVPVML